MASSSSDPKRRNKKHSWADMVVEGPKKAFPEPDKKAKEEVDEVEEEQWWHKDWKEGGKSWDEWWQDREQEWQERKEYEREEGEKANATKEKEECKKEEEKEESALQGTPARWKNRNGSTKERGRRKWMEGKAREAGQDEENVNLVKLAALGNSRMQRIANRQQDRLTQKETAEAAERAATQAAQAAQAAQATAQMAQWQNWQWSQAWQSQNWQQGYYYYPVQWGQGPELLIHIFEL